MESSITSLKDLQLHRYENHYGIINGIYQMEFINRKDNELLDIMTLGELRTKEVSITLDGTNYRLLSSKLKGIYVGT